MGLRFVVVTGVARDDLPDGGARIWAATIRAVREAVPGCGVEVLPTDFKGGERDIATVIDAEPDVFAHNLETVRRLHGQDPSRVRLRPLARGAADRQASARRAGHEVEPHPGHGRDGPTEVAEALARPRRRRLRHRHDRPVPATDAAATCPVDRWVTPDEFAEHKARGEAMGIPHVEAGPLVRSSYHAGTQFQRASAALAGAALAHDTRSRDGGVGL